MAQIFATISSQEACGQPVSSSADAAGMGEEMAEGDPLLAVGRELGDVPRHRIVELQQPALPELRDGHRRHRLGGGEPEHQVIAGERRAGAVLAERRVGHGLAPQRDVELRAEVEPVADPRLDRLPRPGEPVQRAVDHGGGL